MAAFLDGYSAESADSDLPAGLPDYSTRAMPAIRKVRHNRYPVVILLSLLVAIIGVLLYALASNPKISEIGRILFFTGMLVTLMRMGPASISFLR